MLAKARKASAAGVVSRYDALTPTLIAFLADYYLSAELTRDEQARWGHPALKVPYVSRDDREQDYIDSREMLSGYQGQALHDLWGEWTVTFADAMGYTIDPADPEFGRLLEAIAAAACNLWLALDKRIDASQGHGAGAETPPLPAVPQAADAATGAGDTEGSFEAIAVALLSSARQDIGPSTRQSTNTALKLFREAHGTPTPAKITRSMVSGWVDLMAERPAKLPKVQRDMPLREVVAAYADLKDVPRLSANTYNGHASALAALWNKAIKTGQIREDRNNPFANQSATSSLPAPSAAKGFSKEELTAIFELPIFTRGERPKGGKGHASYWMPLLLLWTGARPEEVAQLMIDDFQQDTEGTWLITYTDAGIHPHKGQRRLKTTKHGSGRRTIPVPAALVDLGLPAYLEHLRAGGSSALFPALRTRGARGLLFAAWSEWWANLLYSEGILTKGDAQRQPAREFRHTWTTAARRVNRRDILEYAQGHRAAGGTANEGYGDLAPLGKQLVSPSFEGLDLSSVMPWGL